MFDEHDTMYTERVRATLTYTIVCTIQKKFIITFLREFHTYDHETITIIMHVKF